MARHGVTYEQVASAADALVAAGATGPDGSPTLKALREKLGGTGSPNTIHGHLATWKASRPSPAPIAATLPLGVVRALCDEFERQRREARKDIESELRDAGDTATELAYHGSVLEADLQEAGERLIEVTAVRDRLSGQLEEAQRENERLRGAFDAERLTVEQLRINFAEANEKARGQESNAATWQAEATALRREIEMERKARTDAERNLAAAEASLISAKDRGEQLIKVQETLERRVTELQKTLEEERTKKAEAERMRATSDVRAEAAERRANDLQTRENASRDGQTQANSPKAVGSSKAPKSDRRRER